MVRTGLRVGAEPRVKAGVLYGADTGAGPRLRCGLGLGFRLGFRLLGSSLALGHGCRGRRGLGVEKEL